LNGWQLDAVFRPSDILTQRRMSTPAAKLMVSTLENLACIKVIGRANFAVSVKFKRLLTDLSDKGIKHFVIDLGECTAMDSTFLGDLAGLGLKFYGDGSTKSEGRPIRLLNTPKSVLESIESVGTDRLFQLIRSCEGVPGGFQEVSLDDVSRVENTRNCLEAHKLLMTLDPANVDKFKDVTAFLEQDLQRQQSTTK
jgi:anti-sigma B factor antagonist